MSKISRRFLVLGTPALLAGCVSERRLASLPALPVHDESFYLTYGEIRGERFPVPAVDPYDVNPEYLRRQVVYDGPESAGSIVIDPNERYLYLVQPGGKAMRYGVGVGREGFAWSGAATIRRKSEWPTWTPPGSMIQRQPELAEYAGGMPGGLENPLGARAMYLYQGDRDTLYRIHGTNEPGSIGSAVSSGCIRLINQDIIDLYRRVPIGTRVVVRPAEIS
ncbi:L,D-transpeptidase [Alsobacter sp. SYSU M60028]|uniref:L,D-transpeptidase n=1 Tax=Alsobacter ponti TaxID=2962936 RepID=A0ABT1LIQ3_9HYPH|nr:L,D-transpeptidase [Alsobacter ponti]MCP8941023.1 L,D-transpeptidase [Alsobacter ponti]